VIIDEIRSLNQSIARIEEVIEWEGKKLDGHRQHSAVGDGRRAGLSGSGKTGFLLRDRASRSQLE
jgi:hypothetical protein